MLTSVNAVPPNETPVTVPGAASSFTSVLPTEMATSRSRLGPMPGVCENESVPPMAIFALEPFEVEAADMVLPATAILEI